MCRMPGNNGNNESNNGSNNGSNNESNNGSPQPYNEYNPEDWSYEVDDERLIIRLPDTPDIILPFDSISSDSIINTSHSTMEIYWNTYELLINVNFNQEVYFTVSIRNTAGLSIYGVIPTNTVNEWIDILSPHVVAHGGIVEDNDGPLENIVNNNSIANYPNNGQRNTRNILPANILNAISTTPIQNGNNMVNFQDEFAHGRYYTKNTFNQLQPHVYSGKKRNPYTQQNIEPGNIKRYRAKKAAPAEGGRRRKTKKRRVSKKKKTHRRR